MAQEAAEGLMIPIADKITTTMVTIDATGEISTIKEMIIETTAEVEEEVATAGTIKTLTSAAEKITISHSSLKNRKSLNLNKLVAAVAA